MGSQFLIRELYKPFKNGHSGLKKPLFSNDALERSFVKNWEIFPIFVTPEKSAIQRLAKLRVLCAFAVKKVNERLRHVLNESVMKRLTILLLFVFACSASYSNDESGDDKRMEAFLNKVEKFYKNKEKVSTNWNMPNTNPESNDYNMPTGNIGSVDHETGLLYNSSNGKLLDTDLNIELDTVTGIIYDFKTKKEYFLSDLQSERHNTL